MPGHEVRSRAEAFEHGPCAMVLGTATKKRRDIEDERASFIATIDILVDKNATAQRLAPVVGSGASNRAKRCRPAPCDYAIDRALPLAEIFTALPACPR
jgi:hypothetical protein